jgi:hypothetical protein
MSVPGEPARINPETAHEPSDWQVSAIAVVLAMVLGLVAISVLVLRIVFQTAASDIDRSPIVAMPAPALQIDPAQDLARLRAREDQALNTYYWVDRQNGVVHIPIDQAMRQIVSRGLDGFPQGKP